MKKLLFLTSYSSNVIDHFLSFLPRHPSELKLAFIVTARNPYNISYPSDPEKDKLLSLGFKMFVMDIKGKTEDAIRKELDGIDVIFIAGGNTFYLLEKSVESGFDKIIRELVNRGVVYIGSSAGAVIAGPDIEIVRQLDDPNFLYKGKSTKGFGLVDFLILPHFDSDAYEGKIKDIYRAWNKKGVDLITLLDSQGIIVDESQRQLVVENNKQVL